MARLEADNPCGAWSFGHVGARGRFAAFRDFVQQFAPSRGLPADSAAVSSLSEPTTLGGRW